MEEKDSDPVETNEWIEALDSVLETQGVEIDAVALVGERLTLTTSMAYIDATIDE